VFSWGSGGFYQTGHGDQNNLNFPKMINKVNNVVMASGGVGHSLFLDYSN
jgi:hypothetical protein